MGTVTYKRGQVIWALWQAFSHGGSSLKEKVPTRFQTRVRKLNELGVPFSKRDKPGQSGIDIEYMPDHAFELGVALKCLDIGLKQSEVALFMHHSRDDVRKCYLSIMENPPSPGHGLDKDTSIYMTFRSVEIREAWGVRKWRKREPLIYLPKFHRGLQQVTTEIQNLAMYIQDDSRIVIELSNLAVIITDALKQAPERHRGRP